MAGDADEQRKARMAALQRFIDGIDLGMEQKLAKFEGRVPRADLDVAIDLWRDLGRVTAGTKRAVAEPPQQDPAEAMRGLIAGSERRLEALKKSRESIRAWRVEIADRTKRLEEDVEVRRRIKRARQSSIESEQRIAELEAYSEEQNERRRAAEEEYEKQHRWRLRIEAEIAKQNRLRKAAQERTRARAEIDDWPTMTPAALVESAARLWKALVDGGKEQAEASDQVGAALERQGIAAGVVDRVFDEIDRIESEMHAAQAAEEQRRAAEAESAAAAEVEADVAVSEMTGAGEAAREPALSANPSTRKERERRYRRRQERREAAPRG